MLWPRIIPGRPEFEPFWAAYRLGLCLVLVSVGLGTGGCGESPDTSRPNVLLVTLDTVRADHCSLYGYERDTTPNLRRIATRSAVFETAYAPMATTGPSHATMFTSLYPRTHGFLKNGYVLDEDLTTLAEVLHGQTYHTAAVVGSYAVSSRFGFSQGFDCFDDDFESDGRGKPGRNWEGIEVEGYFDRDGSHVTDRAIRWVSEEWDRSRPFVLWAHYFDAHSPYVPAPEFRNLFTSNQDEPESLASKVAAYDEEILEVDHAVGRLVDFLEASNLIGSTLLIVVGDHGEGLMQHGHMEHGLQLYEEAVRVPLVMSWPGHLGPPRILRESVEILDIMPTVLEMVGASTAGLSIQGRSLKSNIVDDEPLDPQHPVFIERRFYEAGPVGTFDVSGEKFAVRSGRWKFIVAPEEGTAELYDLLNDSGETVNVAQGHAEVSGRLRKLIDRWYTVNTPDVTMSGNNANDDDLDGLKALGYVD
jgi:choline-sulfatase